jgi:hypothetical protein
MAKIGHEAPLFDNKNPADLTPHFEETQLRLRGDTEDPAVKVPEISPALELTEKEETRVQKLVETNGYDRDTALRYTLSASRYRQIHGHRQASRMVTELKDHIKEKAAAETKPGPSVDEITELLRETDPDK